MMSIRLLLTGLVLLSPPLLASATEISAAVDRLTRAARVYDEREMNRAASALARIGRAALPALAKLLDDVDDNVSWQAVVATNRIARNDDTTQQILARGTKDADPDVRAESITGLVALFPKNPATLALVESATRDRHALVRVNAWFGRWSIARRLEAIDELITLLDAKDWMVADAAVNHLGRVGSAAVPPLRTRLRHARSDPAATTATLRALSALGPNAAPIVAEIAPNLRSANRQVARAAERTLVRIGRPALASLRGLADDDSWRVRVRALRSIGEIGYSDPLVARTLTDGLAASSNAVRCASIEAIGRVGRASDTTVERLITLLADKNDDLRGLAITALGRLGKLAAPALDSLRSISRDDAVDHLREAAKSAHDKIMRALAKPPL